LKVDTTLASTHHGSGQFAETGKSIIGFVTGFVVGSIHEESTA